MHFCAVSLNTGEIQNQNGSDTLSILYQSSKAQTFSTASQTATVV